MNCLQYFINPFNPETVFFLKNYCFYVKFVKNRLLELEKIVKKNMEAFNWSQRGVLLKGR